MKKISAALPTSHEDSPPMRWLNQQEFWNHFDNAGVRIDYEGWCFFQIAEDDLKQLIGTISPNNDLTGEDDPPGPVSRWYGNLNGVPVLLDYHHAHPLGDAVVIHHGTHPDARTLVRRYFSAWGTGWQESPMIKKIAS